MKPGAGPEPNRFFDMLDFIFLDSAPLSLLGTPIKPGTPSIVRAIKDWADACERFGKRLVIPEIADYETRRELLRCGKHASIRELDRLKAELIYLPITTAAEKGCRRPETKTSTSMSFWRPKP